MKNIVFSLILASMLVSPAYAQTSATNESVQTMMDSLRAQLMEVLLQQVALLQDQLKDLLAKQETTSTKLGSVEAKIDKVAAPMPVVVTPTEPQKVSLQVYVDRVGKVSISADSLNSDIAPDLSVQAPDEYQFFDEGGRSCGKPNGATVTCGKEIRFIPKEEIDFQEETLYGPFKVTVLGQTFEYMVHDDTSVRKEVTAK